MSKVRADFRVNLDGTPALAVQDTAGKTRAVLGVKPNGSPTLLDAAGKLQREISDR